jgi:hypothetical protein
MQAGVWKKMKSPRLRTAGSATGIVKSIGPNKGPEETAKWRIDGWERGS